VPSSTGGLVLRGHRRKRYAQERFPDRRAGRLHRFFEMDNTEGLCSLLLGTDTTAEVVREVPGFPGLEVLTAGPIRSDNNQLLDSGRIGTVLYRLTDPYDLVIVDSPPVLSVADLRQQSALLHRL
jgi:Mrp family chromosome partitioning ATPase